MGDDSSLRWACTCLPLELLEMLWEHIPLGARALLSKPHYVAWQTAQLAGMDATRRASLDLSKLVRRQITMNHKYTFGLILDCRAQTWSRRRPWRSESGKYPSFLWYLERLCAQADRQEMRALVRHAIDRYEGPTESPSGKSRSGSNSRGRRCLGGSCSRQWVSIA